MELSEQERKANQAAGLIYKKMHKYLSEGTDGFDDRQERMLVREMSEELDELWEKVSTKEIKENQKLTKLFDEFQEHLGFLKSEMEGEEDYAGLDYDEEDCEWDEQPWEDEDDEDSDYEDADWEDEEEDYA